MPISNPHHIPTVLHFVQQLQPRRVLDIGIGTGSYGLLLRQFLEVSAGRVLTADWITEIDGIEIFEPYRNPLWAYAYTRVHMGDIRQIVPKLGAYDLAICNDVLEHFARAEARGLVTEALRHARVLIATTPNRDYPQGAWGGNEAERHHCLLDASDFHGLAVRLPTGITTCYVCTGDRAAAALIKQAALTCPRIRIPDQPFIHRVRRTLGRLRRRFGP